MHAIEVIVQRTTTDCGITVVAMLTGKPYTEVAALAKQRNSALHQGVSMWQLRDLAKAAGVTLRRHKFVITDEDENAEKVGILSIERASKSRRSKEPGHVVIWAMGNIIDPANGTVWLDPPAYLKYGDWRVDCILLPV